MLACSNSPDELLKPHLPSPLQIIKMGTSENRSERTKGEAGISHGLLYACVMVLPCKARLPSGPALGLRSGFAEVHI
jgi:hypothetical protein